jgi:hypothetical protein
MAPKLRPRVIESFFSASFLSSASRRALATDSAFDVIIEYPFTLAFNSRAELSGSVLVVLGLCSVERAKGMFAHRVGPIAVMVGRSF